MIVERRRYPRFETIFPVAVHMLLQGKFFYTISKDVSLGGIKIVSNRFIVKDNFLKLSLNLSEQILDEKARIAWCNKWRISERYSVGLEFLEATAIKQGLLSRFLNNVCRV